MKSQLVKLLPPPDANDVSSSTAFCIVSLPLRFMCMCGLHNVPCQILEFTYVLLQHESIYEWKLCVTERK